MALCVFLASGTAWAASSIAPVSPSPNAPSSVELVEQPKRYDGTVVSFQGEAIGEAMVRGSHAWIHLNDDAYMRKNLEEGTAPGGYNTGMPIYLPTPLAEKIRTFGDYKHEGDIVGIQGEFNAACAQHGGDVDIHAATLKVLVSGHPAEDPVEPWKPWVAIVLTSGAGGLWYLDRSMIHRERRGLERQPK